eukprot:CAMPEP_0171298444 /NCGR_PEP_ID=MMETSP0816-20121228/7239_1 /TAXON_ID=420281 /ORGANISM="Proboscia inermis, Strain CCAP1064/1" /LENGTH=42 /DNA_ID= /DNA_START= /DNA_END= /DNA_ORIENTATION=
MTNCTARGILFDVCGAWDTTMSPLSPVVTGDEGSFKLVGMLS